MKAHEEAEFRHYVAARMDRLRRTAFLYCRDWHTADDLVGTTLVKLYEHWRRAQQAENLDAYVHGILAHAWLDERRKPWRREHTVEDPPEQVQPVTPHSDGDLLALLAELPPRRRACLVLRFYCDLSVEQTAEILGVSTGTVKSQTARALEALRGPATELYYRSNNA
ncbi:MAG: SigE family RNA polymerase sigma factor [Micromonosporaceae bacterium]|nr:SigE family RNA polymerase sigma factor [Micromonosporaceae bacterium]